MFPKSTTVEKGVVSRVLEGGMGLLKTFLGVQSEAATEDVFTPPSTEKMVKQCLHYYLEPFKSDLLSDEGYSPDFKLDEFVRQVKHIFEQHKRPVVQHRHSSIAPVTVDIMDVRIHCKIM